MYRIDENGVLWGCGNNNYGQLGQGTQDVEFHSEMVKIAENVVHVDDSQSGFVIWLTEDGSCTAAEWPPPERCGEEKPFQK